jgi:hypothetical protein
MVGAAEGSAMIEIVEYEFHSGFDAMHYHREKDDIIGINDALFCRMMGWDNDSL